MSRRSAPASSASTPCWSNGERPGGTCLLRGCIPSKALIHAADKFFDIAGAAAGGGNALGIAIDAPPRLDFARTVAWKDGIVDRLTGGVAGLLQRAKVRVVEGWARFSDAKTCTVETARPARSRSPPST